MTTKEARSIFENQLQVFLKEKLGDIPLLKISKNKLVVKRGAAIGNVWFQYLNKSNGYILVMSAEVPELTEYICQLKPPYRSNLLSESVYAMTSSGETSKSFSNQYGGTLRLPLNEDDIEETCNWIANSLQTIFLPRLMNLLELRKATIQDVLEHPEYYAYPLLTIVKVIIKNQLRPTSEELELFLSKKMSRNKNFDRGLLAQCVTNI